MTTNNTATEAIARSIANNEIVTLEWSPASQIALFEECDSNEEYDTRIEYLGTDEDGEEWRVHLDTSKRARQIESAIRDLASQDQGDDVDDSYARTGDAVDTIQRWRASAGQAGDRDLCELIEAAGVEECARIYESVRS